MRLLITLLAVAAPAAAQITTEDWFLNPSSNFVSAVLQTTTRFVGAADTAGHSPWGSGGDGYKAATLSGEAVFDPNLILLLAPQLVPLGQVNPATVVAFPAACYPSNRFTSAEVQARTGDSSHPTRSCHGRATRASGSPTAGQGCRHLPRHYHHLRGRVEG